MIGVPVLSIAGSDPSGGAGIQADLKSISACGGYGMSVLTALTAQNTLGVRAVFVPPTEFLAQQLDAVLGDVEPAAIKIGMLGSAAVIDTVREALSALERAGGRPLVVLDPVMVATSGDRLMDADAEAALHRLMAHVDLVTPNAPELGVLSAGAEPSCTADLVTQARALAHRHRVWVLAKGGHLLQDAAQTGGPVTDVLVSPQGDVEAVEHEYVNTPNTHGTGCSLSSALATFAARGADWPSATRLAVNYLAHALSRADELRIGAGHGPVHHLAALWDGRGVPSLGLASDWWEQLAARAEASYSTTVVRALAGGFVEPELFQDYLGQDLAYLQDYAEHLDAASAAAARLGDAEGAAFWAASATSCREEEPQLHTRLGAGIPAPDAITRAYARHLAAASAAGYPVLAAALLPCFSLYAQVGARLGPGLGDDASADVRDWVGTYADPAFADVAARAMALLDALAEDADRPTRELMRRAMAESLEREIAFFDR